MKTTENNNRYSTWGIKRHANGRFCIFDTSSDIAIDNAQGHGFDSYDSAYYFGYNKFHTKGACNGKPNIDEFITLF